MLPKCLPIRPAWLWCFAVAGVLSHPALPSAVSAGPPEYFDLASVRLLAGPFKNAQELDREYILALEPDRLLAGFRLEAGLEPKAEKYPNWESSGLDGHTAGHYLTALAQMWAATGDTELKRRLDYMVSELAECQRANGNGYVGAVPHSRELWAVVAAGRFDAGGFSLSDAWVPWYNMHKTFAGLRDAWLIAHNAQARDVLVALADWAGEEVGGLSDEKMQVMLRTEQGGMNEVLADVYAITGDRKYLELAKRFSHRAILDPLLRHEDHLTGLHANTQIPKVIGFDRIAELGGDPAWADASQFFWDTVVENRSVAFGGNSVREHFNPPDDFSSMIESREGPESCNTYNMLRLTEHLFRAGPSARLADYYERALYNHILSTENPVRGGFVYFTPIRPQQYRVYSQPTKCFWCCVGTGMENHGKYGRFIYAHNDDTLWVNLFLASELTWEARGLTIRQETTFPDEPATRLTLHAATPQEFAICVRYPGWIAAGALRIRINGEPVSIESGPSSYVPIERTWSDGDRLEIDLPMTTRLERLPDDSDYAAVLHGPIVLAAKTDADELEGQVADDSRMGHVAPGPYIPLDESPMLVGDFDSMSQDIVPVAGKPFTFEAEALIRPAKFKHLLLEPFYRIHDARYMMYWRVTSPDEYKSIVADLAAKEHARLELERMTIDQVAPGEQQPEAGHNFRGEATNTGVNLGRHWRDASGWFSYDLRAPSGGALALRVTTFGLDRDRAFRILINGQELAVVHLNGDDGERFVETSYAVPDAIVSAAGDGVLTVRFLADADSRTGGIYGVRLVRHVEP